MAFLSVMLPAGAFTLRFGARIVALRIRLMAVLLVLSPSPVMTAARCLVPRCQHPGQFLLTCPASSTHRTSIQAGSTHLQSLGSQPPGLQGASQFVDAASQLLGPGRVSHLDRGPHRVTPESESHPGCGTVGPIQFQQHTRG